MLSIALVAFALPGDSGQLLPGSYSVEYAVFWTSMGIAAWSWLFAITGLARIHLTRGSSALFYVFHQTAVVLIAWKLVEADLPLPVEFLVLLGLAFFATAAASFAVRQAKLGRRVFGMAAPAPHG